MAQPNDSYSSCAFCRFMRSLAFSAIGAGVAGYLAIWMGVERKDAIIVAFFGALAAVVLVSRKKQK
ncbi:MAG: hypothetical protein P8Z39_02990 [Gammaproteobacteria bacterium]|jgi:hypothetical protein